MQDHHQQAIINACREHGLQAIEKHILSVARLSLRLDPVRAQVADLPLGHSRIGGVPDMGPDLEWPTWKGAPLAFIAQLDLAALPASAMAKELPDTGHLLFFYDAMQETWGFDPKDLGSWRVLYQPPGKIERRTLPAEMPEEGRYAHCTVSFIEELRLPSVESPMIAMLELTEEQSEAYERLVNDLHGSRKPDELCEPAEPDEEDEEDEEEDWDERSYLLGHPDEIQGDMQLECALVSNGLYCGDESGYEDPRAQQIAPDALSWRLLLQIGTHDEAGMMWGDVGCIYFWIRGDDLAARRFDKTWMILQCC